MPTIVPRDMSPSDVDDVVRQVALLERAQQHEDVDGFLALFDPEAVWVTGGGVRLIGLDTISEFTRKVLPGAMSDGSVTYQVDHVFLITSDVVLTGVNQQYFDREGRPTSAGRPSYIWRRAGTSWKIVAGQNTGVVTDE
jgi:uncharacterized protein (TIGR02246 family)